jgi:predicted metalloprotease
MKRLALCLAATGALLGSSEATPVLNTNIIPLQEFTAADKQLVHDTAQSNMAYWSQSIGNISTVVLVTVEGNQVFNCVRSPEGSDEALTAQSANQYCPGNNSIVITANSVNATQAIGLGSLGVIFSISHEFGHAIQKQQDTISERFDGTLSQKADLEVQATCFAGHYIAAQQNPEIIDKVADHLRHNPVLEEWGTPDKQADAFLAGAHSLSAC